MHDQRLVDRIGVSDVQQHRIYKYVRLDVSELPEITEKYVIERDNDSICT